MKIELQLFGAFRAMQTAPVLTLELADGSSVAALRAALNAYGAQHWPNFRSGLLAASAFASDAMVLREQEPLPADGRVAILPPVSGG